MTHLEESNIIDLAEHRLSDPDVAACQAHLNACSVCTEKYHFWRQFSAALTSPRLENASEELIQRCISIFPGAPPESGFRRFIGQIIFDSFATLTPALALRGDSDARQMVIQMDEFDIHLRITGDSRQTIQGQILPLGDPSAVNAACVTLLALGRTTQTTKSDHLGLFAFRDVPKAPIVISIKLQSNRLVGLVSIPESNSGG